MIELEKLNSFMMPEVYNMLESDAELQEQYIAMMEETFLAKCGRYPKESKIEFIIAVAIIEYYAMGKGNFNLSEITTKNIEKKYSDAIKSLSEIKSMGDLTSAVSLSISKRFTNAEANV